MSTSAQVAQRLLAPGDTVPDRPRIVPGLDEWRARLVAERGVEPLADREDLRPPPGIPAGQVFLRAPALDDD
ncbi:MAG TPA: hypothetical protein VGQ47_00615 [Candidatus Limnocylindrales bacterium]|nr:hypothetical protein [Candidatus Limnocylindrales bacterium]